MKLPRALAALSRRQRIAVGTLAALLAVAVAWLSASALLELRIERALRARVSARSAPFGFQLYRLSHQRGLITGRGTAELRLSVGCSRAARERMPVWRVAYEITHVPLPARAASFHWSAELLRAAGVEFASTTRPRFEGDGEVAYDGTVTTQLRSAQVQRQAGQPHVELNQAGGRLLLRGAALDLQLRAASLKLRDAQRGEFAELENLRIHWRLRDRSIGLGTTRLELGAVHTPSGSAAALTVTTQGSLVGDRAELRLRASAAQITFAGEPFERVLLDAAASGLHALSLKVLLDQLASSCNLMLLDDADAAALHAASGEMFRHGLSLRLSKLEAHGERGMLRGDLGVELSPAATAGPGASVDISSRVRSLGHLDVEGSELAARLAQAPLIGRFLVPTAQGARASYAFDAGVLTVNGRAWNPLLVRMTLNLLQPILNGL